MAELVDALDLGSSLRVQVRFLSGLQKIKKIMEVSLIAGWVAMILSWIIPSFIKDQKKQSIVGIIISSLALGIFIGHTLEKIFK